MFSNEDLFTNFGLSSTPKEAKKSRHTKFTDTDYDMEENLPLPCQNGHSSPEGENSNSDEADSSSVESEPKNPPFNKPSTKPKYAELTEFIESIGCENVDKLDLDAKIAFLIESYQKIARENDSLKTAKLRADIDTMPSCSTGEPSLYCTIGADEVEMDASQSNLNSSRSLTCFNCQGNHLERDCPEPRDETKVRENRAHMRRVKEREQPKKRYAEEVFKAGQISDGLREALGLDPNDLPGWIYRMRILGYPPGYKQDAFQEPSGLQLMDGGGNAISCANMNALRGSYTMNRVVNYPGFNAPVPEGVLDKSQTLGIPPYKSQDEKENLVVNWNNDLNIQTPILIDNEDSLQQNASNNIDEETSFDVQIIDSIESPDQSRANDSVEILECNDKGKVPDKNRIEEIPTDCLENTTFETIDFVTPNTSIIKLEGAPSVNISMGTPILQSGKLDLGENPEINGTLQSNMAAENLNPTRKPSLESFSQGINKFEVLEESIPCRGGGYNKLKAILMQRKK